MRRGGIRRDKRTARDERPAERVRTLQERHRREPREHKAPPESCAPRRARSGLDESLRQGERSGRPHERSLRDALGGRHPYFRTLDEIEQVLLDGRVRKLCVSRIALTRFDGDERAEHLTRL